MRKRRIAILLVAAVALVFLAVTFIPRKAEPSYQGKPLSSWLEEHFGMGLHSTEETKQAEEAIRHIGTNGIPWLLGWASDDSLPPRWKMKLLGSLPDKVQESRLVQRLYGVHAEARAIGAGEAFRILGTNAIAPLMTIAANSNAPMRLNAIYVLGYLDTNAIPALPLILKGLAEPDPEVAEYSAAALANLRLDPEHALPVLTNRFLTAGGKLKVVIMVALRCYGKEAGPAVPTILNALNDADPEVQKHAVSILQRIAPEALKANSVR